MNKKLPTIKFKGRDYTLISERVKFFNEEYPKGFIKTEVLSQPDADRVVVKASVYPSEGKVFTGHSQARYSDTSSFVNKTSALEVAETSAVGRALAFMNIGVTDSIASIDEINKTTHVISSIKNSKPITADQYQNALDAFPEAVRTATRQAHHDARQEYKTNKNAYAFKTLSDPHNADADDIVESEKE